jgi:hypothetical protein
VRCGCGELLAQWPVALLTFGQEDKKCIQIGSRYTVCPSTLGLLEKVIVDDWVRDKTLSLTDWFNVIPDLWLSQSKFRAVSD